MSRVALLWFRRDLRLADHGALQQALCAADRVVPVYVHAPQEEGEGAGGAASRWWLHHSLRALDRSLRARGSRLHVWQGATVPALLALAQRHRAEVIFWHAAYEPSLQAQERRVRDALSAVGLKSMAVSGSLLFDPLTVRNAAGQPFRVFTPFWRCCRQALMTLGSPFAVPARIPHPRDAGDDAAGTAAAVSVSGAREVRALEQLELLPKVRWDRGLAAAWQPGESGAQDRLQRFAAGPLARYGDERDRLAAGSTSRLSPALRFGELSARQIVAAISGMQGTEAFLRQLGWREFSAHLLFHFPQTAHSGWDARGERGQQPDHAGLLAAWQRGRTGIPLVDAGLRELWHTGWMHNRARMVAASFLTKNLGISWREGVRWFNDTLLDADLANNTMGWQWVAGCGIDAAPYHRFINPVLQAERFDPQRAYIRAWCPELAGLPEQWMHRPFAAPASVLDGAGVRLGREYPHPVVDLVLSREQALARWRR